MLEPHEELASQPTEWRLVGTVEDWAPVLMSTNYADHLAIEDAAAAEQRGAVFVIQSSQLYKYRPARRAAPIVRCPDRGSAAG